MNDSKKKIDKIHSEISDKYEKEKKNNELTKKEEEIINQEFYKIFKIKESNQDNIFDFLNNINQSHIKKYKKIFKFLNLNLVPENIIKIASKEKVKKNEKINNNKNENIKINEAQSRENINKDEDIKLDPSIKEELEKSGKKNIENKNKKEEIQKENNEIIEIKENIYFEKEGYSNEINIKNKNKIFKNKKNKKINKSIKKEIKYIKQVNAIQNNNKNLFWKNSKDTKDLLNFKENKDDNSYIDKEIIINENDDSFGNINVNYYIIKNKRNKQNKIYLKSSNNTSSFQDQPTIINDNFDNNYSYFKNDNIKKIENPINDSKNINKKTNFSNNIIINNFKNKSEIKGLKKNNLNEIEVKGKKSKINKNELKKSKREINKEKINFHYTGLEDKNKICSCILY